MIEFTKLIVDGFCNIDHLELSLNTKGITIIRGANGFGKSSIFSSLVWGLYGKNIKGVSNVNTWEKVRPKSYKGTKVEVFFQKDGNTHNVVRCLNFKGELFDGAKGNSRLLYVIDACPTEAKNKSDIQSLITDSLEMSYNLFMNTIMFGQGMTRLIQESGTEQKSIFEEIFELEYITKARKIAQDKYKNIHDENEELSHQLSEYNSHIKEFNNVLEDIQNSEKGWESENKSKKEKLKSELNLTTKSLLKLEPKLKETQPDYDINERLKVIKDRINKYETKINQAKEEINGVSLEELINEVIKLLEKRDYSSSLNMLRSIKEQYSIIENCNAKLRVFYNESGDLYKLRYSLNKIESQINQYKTKIKSLKDRIKSHDKSKPDFNSMRHKMEAKISKYNDKINKLKPELEERIKNQEDYQWVYSEALGNNGIKAFLFESSLVYLNEVLESYSDAIGLVIQIYVDLESSRKDFKVLINKEGQDVQFEELSGGEKQLASLAMAFAMNEIMNNNKEVNLAFLDEIFESLSADNIELVSNLIRKIYRDKTLFLITHHESLPIPNVTTLKVTKVNGIAYYEF